MAEPSARVRSLVEPLVEAAGLYLFDLEQTGGKLIVTVDAPEGGADMATIAEVTRSISRTLDDQDPIDGKYVLEVTSPGLERPLRTPAHYAWAVGKEITVRRRGGDDLDKSARRVTGVLQAADDDGITVAAPGQAGGETVRLAYDDIDKARTVFDFDAAFRSAKQQDPGASDPAGARRHTKAG